MSAESGLQPEMANVDRPNDLPIATEQSQSDDLFGEEVQGESVDAVVKEPTNDVAGEPVKDVVDDVAASKPVPAVTELSENGPPTPADSQSVEQPTSDAAQVTENSSGIEGVAKYLPSDANLERPLVSPSEPLGDGEARITEDIELTDAPSLATESEPALPVSEPPTSEDLKPVGTDSVVATSPNANQPATDLTNGVANVSNSENTEPASEKITVKSDLPNGNSESVMVAPPAQAPATLPVDNDQEMSDAPSAGTVRAREEDDATGEPSAKRTKTGDDLDGEAQVEFKTPSTAPQSAPVPTPGNTNGIAVSVVRPHHTPKISSGPITKNQKAFLIEKMKNTKKVKSAFWFTKPVDYVALNIPHYPTIVKQPMDLTTIEHKLKSDQYSSVDDLVSDFELMVTNCFTFNGINHAASISAQNLRAYFMKQMQMCPTGEAAMPKSKPVAKKASPKPAAIPRPEPAKPAAPAKSPANETFALLPDGTPMIRRDSTAGRPKRAVIPPAPRDLPYSTSKPKRKEAQTGLKFCEHILEEFRKSKWDRFAAPFRIPVDPVALNIPNYFSVIKEPMDISTITQRLKGGQYATAAEFKHDFDLMFQNCFKFNPSDNIVHQMGKDFQTEFEREWTKKDSWIKRHTPQSQRASPVSDVSDGDDSDDAHDEDDEHDSNEATISLLREQLAAMQNMVASISGNKRASPKASGSKKKSKSGSGVMSKPSKKSGGVSNTSRPTIKSTSKPKKQRLVTYDEKQEISSATENMSAEQVERLTSIITENVAKYKDMAGDDVELEIDDLPNEVQHKLLRYVRSIFPKAEPVEMDANAIDDDYEPEKPSARSGGAAKKKHKPMKKHEQEDRIRQLKEQMAAMGDKADALDGGGAAPSAARRTDSSDDDDSESSEEE
ncbi:Bromodomain-containing protein [Aureobasidium pullulans]|uniref:Bromodomain-containing protein n=1 Tax=Aureobasidium pullulans TaxID=5580 RepID=A0A4S9UQH6_AURPU|nr:Bromodomain-containing protein [Aureobasidium pullulans]THW29810.1 Bromodomain-containing protein [Aureobasidium pullulans]THW46618.1 Bromodomain-containing protein [Aureobasidium pullulans]THY79752.1 Bromodomain-containing protein [Aureobasidium pullulans]THZ40128.1 Bromodomain-containing protein [Aureobasidium pullulans]